MEHGISQRFQVGSFPPRRAAGRGRGWYRGDCHVHTLHSHGGELAAAQLADQARAAGLDFIAVTEHNRADTHGEWGARAGDDLLVICGQEVTTRTGHWLALDITHNQTIDWDYGVRDGLIEQQLRRVRDAGGRCVAAHPHAPYPSGQFMYPFEAFDAVEVWNGLWDSDLPWNADNQAALAEWGRSLASGIHNGRWLPAVGNSDTHLAGQVGVPHIVVFAEALGVDAILDGVFAGRSWIAGSNDVELSFAIVTGDSSAGIGDRLKTSGQPAVATVAVRGVPEGMVSFHTDRGKVCEASLPDDGTGSVEWRTTAAESAFVRVEIRRPGGDMAALTNPTILHDR